MKNGWYKTHDKDDKWTDFWPENNQMVFVENNMIIGRYNEMTKKIDNVRTVVSKEDELNMTVLEFDGIGCA